MSEFSDRALGAFIGLATGDALGTTLEFCARDTHPEVRDMIGGGPFNLKPGVWTDDTSMALCLAESILENGGFAPADVLARFLEWRESGTNSVTGECFDIGMTTGAALTRYQRTGNIAAGSTNDFSAGNGSIMRLAPVPVWFAGDIGCAVDAARTQSRTTHGARLCLVVSDIMTSVLVTLLCAPAGQARQSLVPGLRRATDAAMVEWELEPDTLPSWWRGEVDLPQRGSIKSSGFVLHTFEAAMWATLTTNSFEDALILAVNLADDADTVGAVTGQIAGALYGYDQIPNRWLETLAWRAKLEDVGRALTQGASA
jgi:ADP-ribosyl-[dinitrogen reductase] hydrolase